MDLSFWEINTADGVKISSDAIGADEPEKLHHNLGGFRIISTDNRLGLIKTFITGIHGNENQIVMGDKIASGKLAKLAHKLKTNFGHEDGLVAFSTSGSSGEPKIVVHESRALLLAANKIVNRHQVTKGQRFHHLFPENYMAGLLNNILVPSMAQSSVFLDDVFNFSSPFTLLSVAKKFGTTGAWLSPSMIASLSSGTTSGLSAVWNFAFSATGPLTQSTRDKFHKAAGLSLLNTYGTTEQLFIATETQSSSEITCGLPLKGVSLRQGDASGIKSLQVRSDTTAKAVLQWDKSKNDYEVTWIGFGEYLDTNDLFDINSDELKILGRSDNIVVLGGKNISLEKIEEITKELAFVDDCCAFAQFGGTVADISILCEGQISNVEMVQLREHLRSKLGTSSPRNILIGKIPRTFSGKPDRQKLINQR